MTTDNTLTSTLKGVLLQTQDAFEDAIEVAREGQEVLARALVADIAKNLLAWAQGRDGWRPPADATIQPGAEG